MSDYLQKEIAFLGTQSSPAFVRAPEERLRGAVHPGARGESVVGHRGPAKDLLAFLEVNNTMWLIEKHGFTSPAAFRQNQLQPVAKAT